MIKPKLQAPDLCLRNFIYEFTRFQEADSMAGLIRDQYPGATVLPDLNALPAIYGPLGATAGIP